MYKFLAPTEAQFLLHNQSVMLFFLFCDKLLFFNLSERVKQNGQEKVQKHPISNKNARNEIYCNQSLRGRARKGVKHNLIPIFCCQHDKRGDKGIQERVIVVSYCSENLWISEGTTKKLHSYQSVNENKKK